MPLFILLTSLILLLLLSNLIYYYNEHCGTYILWKKAVVVATPKCGVTSSGEFQCTMDSYVLSCLPIWPVSKTYDLASFCAFCFIQFNSGLTPYDGSSSCVASHVIPMTVSLGSTSSAPSWSCGRRNWIPSSLCCLLLPRSWFLSPDFVDFKRCSSFQYSWTEEFWP